MKRFVAAILPAVLFTVVIGYLIEVNAPSPDVLTLNTQALQGKPTIPFRKVFPTVQIALTTVDQQNALTPQNPVTFSNNNLVLSQATIAVDDQMTYQQILGFGASLTGSTVWELENKLTQPQRDALMTQLFDPNKGIGISLLRQPVGASDQDAPGESPPTGFCSYDDNAGDTNLALFSIQHDISSHTIDLLQQAMHINPLLHVLAVPYCAPQWMLTYLDGYTTLNPVYYDVYSKYLIKFVQAYASQKPPIPIWGIIPQNEPVHSYANIGNNMTADQEGTLIANSLGPAMKRSGLNTKLLIYDHNWDVPEFPEQILAGPAGQYVAGTSWHKYAGDVDAQSTVHNMYPDKGTFFTEDSPPVFDTDWNRYMPEAANRIIDILHNWSQSYVQWTLASNPDFGPGTCKPCGADTYVDDVNGNVTYALPYYLLGHLSKYVKPQSYRIDSTDLGSGNIRSLAFKNPDGSIALVVYNGSSAAQTFTVNWQGASFSYALPSNAMATFIWSPTK